MIDILGIVSNLEEDDSITFLELFSKSMRSSAEWIADNYNEPYNNEVLISELKTICEVDSRIEIQETCKQLIEDDLKFQKELSEKNE